MASTGLCGSVHTHPRLHLQYMHGVGAEVGVGVNEPVVYVKRKFKLYDSL